MTEQKQDDPSPGFIGRRFDLMLPDIQGKTPRYLLAADSGFRHLALALGRSDAPLPDFEVSFTKDELVNPNFAEESPDDWFGEAPVHILAAALVDLIPNQQWDDNVQILLYESDKMLLCKKDLAPIFDRRLDSLLHAFTTPEELDDWRDKTVRELANKAKLAQLEFALENVMGEATPYNLTLQMIKFILAREMRWLWVVPAPFRMENQMDQIKTDTPSYRPTSFLNRQQQQANGESVDQNPRPQAVKFGQGQTETPLIWYLSWLMQALVMSVDTILFGIPRECRLMAKKYGLDNPELRDLTMSHQPRLKNEYSIRKAMSEDSCIITLRALGQEDLVDWLFKEAKTEGGRMHDVCDAIGLIFEEFRSNTRSTNYSQKEKQRIQEYLDKVKARRDGSRKGYTIRINHRDAPFDEDSARSVELLMRKRYKPELLIAAKKRALEREKLEEKKKLTSSKEFQDGLEALARDFSQEEKEEAEEEEATKRKSLKKEKGKFTEHKLMSIYADDSEEDDADAARNEKEETEVDDSDPDPFEPKSPKPKTTVSFANSFLANMTGVGNRKRKGAPTDEEECPAKKRVKKSEDGVEKKKRKPEADRKEGKKDRPATQKGKRAPAKQQKKRPKSDAMDVVILDDSVDEDDDFGLQLDDDDNKPKRAQKQNDSWSSSFLGSNLRGNKSGYDGGWVDSHGTRYKEKPAFAMNDD